MNAQVERFANEAIFTLQFNTREAVRYVQRNAQVSETQAARAIKEVTTFHKH
jgi:predicted transcriptional regulator